MEVLLNKIANLVKLKSTRIYVVFMLAALAVFSYNNYSVFIKGFRYLYNLLIELKHHWITFTIIVIAILLIKKVFNISDKKSKIKIDEYHREIVDKTQVIEGLSFKCVENNDKYKNYSKKIYMYAISEDVYIKHIKGEISFYNGNYAYEKDICLFRLPFEFNNFQKNSIEILYNDYKYIDWNYYCVYIIEMDNDNGFFNGLKYRSKGFHRTRFMEYNSHRFYDYKFCGIKTKYNLIWLKERINDIKSALSFFYSKKRFYFGGKKIPLYDRIFDPPIRILKRILVLIIYLIPILLTFFLVYDLWKAIYIIIKYLGNRV